MVQLTFDVSNVTSSTITFHIDIDNNASHPKLQVEWNNAKEATGEHQQTKPVPEHEQ